MDAPANVRGAATRVDGRRVLVVDDDVDFADGLRDLLESRSYVVETAPASRQALKLQAAFDPEVALLDIGLGCTSGIDLAAELKRRRPDLICIMITAHAEIESAVGALRAGTDDYLRKPFQPAELFATLERAMANLRFLEEKQATDDALRESETRYREIFEESPVGIWEEDWSAVKKMVERLARRGVKDWRKYFTRHPDRFDELYDLMVITQVSRATLELFRAPDITAIDAMDWSDTISEDERRAVFETLLGMIAGEASHEVEVHARRCDGTSMITRERVVVPPEHRDDWSRIFYAVEDITQRKQAEEAVQKSEARYREIFEKSPISIREEDFSKVKAHIDALEIAEPLGFIAHLDRNPEFVAECAGLIDILDVNQAALRLHGIDDKEQFMAGFVANLGDKAMKTLRSNPLVSTLGPHEVCNILRAQPDV